MYKEEKKQQDTLIVTFPVQIRPTHQSFHKLLIPHLPIKIPGKIHSYKKKIKKTTKKQTHKPASRSNTNHRTIKQRNNFTICTKLDKFRKVIKLSDGRLQRQITINYKKKLQPRNVNVLLNNCLIFRAATPTISSKHLRQITLTQVIDIWVSRMMTVSVNIDSQTESFCKTANFLLFNR